MEVGGGEKGEDMDCVVLEPFDPFKLLGVLLLVVLINHIVLKYSCEYPVTTACRVGWLCQPYRG